MYLCPINKHRHKGLKAFEEISPQAEKNHCPMFVREGEAPAAAESSGANETYRFDYSEQTQKYQVDQGRQLEKHLSGISWNGGATRPALDTAAFLTGTWAYAFVCSSP